MESAITVKGQMTLPKPIRERLRLKPGDRVKFFVDTNGRVFLLPKLPASALRGMLRARKHATLEEMDEAIAAAISQRYRRSKRK